MNPKMAAHTTTNPQIKTGEPAMVGSIVNRTGSLMTTIIMQIAGSRSLTINRIIGIMAPSMGIMATDIRKSVILIIKARVGKFGIPI